MKKKIVVLDNVALKGKDLSLDVLEGLGKVTQYLRTAREQTVQRIADAEIVLTNKVFIDKAVIDACPNIKFISILATGINVVDCEYARQKGITVSNVPAYSTESVAQLTVALILELYSKVGVHNASVKRGEWAASPDFSYTVSPLVEICGKTLGIIGYGNIGKRVAEIAKALGMRVLIYNRTPFDGSISLDELYLNSDVITLHCPLTAQNAQMINKTALSKMKRGAYLINTARGGLIDEIALAAAIKDGTLAGAGLDVLCSEPPVADNPLLDLENCIITPHVAWATVEARQRLIDATYANIDAYIGGKAINVVN